MKTAHVSIWVVGLPVAMACSSSSTSSSDAGTTQDTGAGSSTSSGSSSGAGSSSSSSGTTSSSTSSGTASGSGGDSGGVGVDCTVAPCTTKGLVCCPAVNECTPPSQMACPSPVWVACTRTSDCMAGDVCCVTAATTTGSGPSGSECRTACIQGGQMPDQGPACNVMDPNGGLGDCPTPLNQWIQCVQVSNSPASLGLCIAKVNAE